MIINSNNNSKLKKGEAAIQAKKIVCNEQDCSDPQQAFANLQIANPGWVCVAPTITFQIFRVTSFFVVQASVNKRQFASELAKQPKTQNLIAFVDVFHISNLLSDLSHFLWISLGEIYFQYTMFQLKTLVLGLYTC